MSKAEEKQDAQERFMDVLKEVKKARKKGFIDLACTLARIYKDYLWENEFTTFKGFCKGALDMPESKAIKYIQAAYAVAQIKTKRTATIHDIVQLSRELVFDLEDDNSMLPQTFEQASLLAPYTVSKQIEIWDLAFNIASDKLEKVGERHIKKAINTIFPPPIKEDQEQNALMYTLDELEGRAISFVQNESFEKQVPQESLNLLAKFIVSLGGAVSATEDGELTTQQNLSQDDLAKQAQANIIRLFPDGEPKTWEEDQVLDDLANAIAPKIGEIKMQSGAEA